MSDDAPRDKEGMDWFGLVEAFCNAPECIAGPLLIAVLAIGALALVFGAVKAVIRFGKWLYETELKKPTA